MNTNDRSVCEQVQLAAMAHLDREHADLTRVEVDAHLAGCAECRTAIAALATVHGKLNRLEHESLDVDVWPGVHQAIASGTRREQGERRMLLALAAVLAFWRLAQLSIGLPAPVVNSIVPLALTVLVLWRVVGDPFAIQITTHQLQREGVR